MNTNSSMSTLDAILSRRSVRSFENTPLNSEQIEAILKAAMHAPSAGNAQPWRFVVVDDKSLLNAVTKIHPYAQMAAEAPLAILVCGDLQAEKYPGYWPQDCGAAIQNMLLAARSSGLGAVWTGIYPNEPLVAPFRELFGLPASVVPMAFVVIGRPAGAASKVDRYRPEYVHRNKW